MKAILTYHSLDPSGSAISVDAEAFRRHVEWLAEAGPPVLGLRSLLDAPADSDGVAITFDDAFESFERVAAPLLSAHGLPATLFVVTEHVGGTNAWGGEDEPGIPTLPLMGWDALRRALSTGFEVGAHTRTHARLPAQPHDRLLDELRGAAEELEARLGVRPSTFCYPYGAVDDRVAAAAAAVYDVACTTEFGVLDGRIDRIRLPRLDMYYFRDPRRLETWGRGAFRRYVRFRAAGRRVRAALAGAGRGAR